MGKSLTTPMQATPRLSTKSMPPEFNFNTEGMTPAALEAWARLTAKYPELTVSSAYRSPSHNKKVGGASRSQHMHGNAFDIPVKEMPRERRLELIRDARAAGFNGVGVYNNSLHFDVGPQRAWGPDYHKESIPDWAKPALAGRATPHQAIANDAMAAIGKPSLDTPQAIAADTMAVLGKTDKPDGLMATIDDLLNGSDRQLSPLEALTLAEMTQPPPPPQQRPQQMPFVPQERAANDYIKGLLAMLQS